MIATGGSGKASTASRCEVQKQEQCCSVAYWLRVWALQPGGPGSELQGCCSLVY